MTNVSVIIPTYNGARFIREALDSVFAQTLPPREIIVVDDCSTDGTPELVEDIGKVSALPLRLLRLKQNSGGPAHPMNVGVSEAKTEFVAILDQDDIYDPENLEQQAAAFLAFPDSGFVFSWCGQIGKEGTQQSEAAKQQILQVGRRVDDSAFLIGAEARRLLLQQGGGMVVGFPAMMFRKATWEATGGFRESLRIAVDYDFELAATMVGDVAVVPRTGYWRRIHDRNVCRDVKSLVHEVMLVKALFAVEHKGSLPSEGPWSELIRGAAWFERECGRHGSAIRLLCHALIRFPGKPATLMALIKSLTWQAVRFRQRRQSVTHTKSAPLIPATR